MSGMKKADDVVMSQPKARQCVERVSRLLPESAYCREKVPPFVTFNKGVGSRRRAHRLQRLAPTSEHGNPRLQIKSKVVESEPVPRLAPTL